MCALVLKQRREKRQECHSYDYHHCERHRGQDGCQRIESPWRVARLGILEQEIGR